MAKRANDAESANPQAIVGGSSCPLQPTTTTVVVSASGTGEPVAVPVGDVSNGCGEENEQISGTTYTTRSKQTRLTPRLPLLTAHPCFFPF
jgi:hypothetical protein